MDETPPLRVTPSEIRRIQNNINKLDHNVTSTKDYDDDWIQHLNDI